MLRIFLKQMPVQTLSLIPFRCLGKILSHKQQFLARMHHHQTIGCSEIAELLRHCSRHLVNHRFLQMHNFVMRKHQHIILAVSIHKAECDLILMVLTENRIALHILKEIVHPSHVPFISKAKTAVIHISSYLRPGCRFFRDHHSPRISLCHNRIQMLQESNGLIVLIAAILIRNPVAGRTTKIKIQHGSHCVHTQTIHMELLNPE